MEGLVVRINGNEFEPSQLTGADLSDTLVAAKVRMLSRSDLNHELICMMGRDRILKLSAEVAHLKKLLADNCVRNVEN